MPEPASDRTLDEDLIEATIRRVAEAQAAREGAAEGETAPGLQPDDEEEGDLPDLEPDPALAPLNITRSAAPTSVDEDAIQAAIRRVAEAKAAREREDDPPAPEAGSPEDLVPAPPEVLRPAARKPTAPARPPSVPQPRREIEGDGGDWREAMAQLERRIDEHDGLLRSIAGRLDALAASVPHGGGVSSRPGDGAWVDEGDESPAPAPMPIGMPPRPAILRDVSAESTPSILRDRPGDAPPPRQPAPAEIDTRPLPAPLPPIQPDNRRGLDLLPRTYRITVEDKRRGVDLVPLHRALLAMDGVRDMSLLSYNNGVALVALETVSDIDPESLRRAVSRAMSRDARVETHNEHTLVVKLAED